MQVFQSTHPSWGATLYDICRGMLWLISIHAPIVGCDLSIGIRFHQKENFNPRTHRGVRLNVAVAIRNTCKFQSTHPSWGATTLGHPRWTAITLFQSTHPSWGATVRNYRTAWKNQFQSTHPSWGATSRTGKQLYQLAISIHAPIVGCDMTFKACLYVVVFGFQSTHPSWGATSSD